MSLKQINSFIFIVILTAMFLHGQVSAETSVKGMAQFTHEGWGKPDAEDKEALRAEAIKSAISRWASRQGSAFLKNYDKHREYIESNLTDYILGVEVLTEDYDKKSKQFKMVVRANVDNIRLTNFINSSAAISSASELEKSYMTFVFLSRRQTLVKSFDDKIAKRVDTFKQEEGQEYQNSSSSGVKYIAQNNTSQQTIAGGSSTKKADVVEYDVGSSADINIAISNVFTQNGFEIVEAEYLEEETNGLISVDAFKADFSIGNDISGKTKRNAAKGAKSIDVPYLAVGTLDIGISEKDPATGNDKVFVTVTGKVIDVTSRFPKTIASIGPIQYAGLGPNQSVAETNALLEAAETAAVELVNQINAKGIM